VVRDDTSRRRVVPDAARGSLWLSAAWTGVGAAAVCATLGIVAVSVCWLPVAGATAHPMSALHAGLLTFLAALHGGITVDGTSGAFLPLGLLIIVALAAYRAGSALGDSAADLDERDPARLGQALLVQTLAFTITALITIPFAHLGTSSAPLLGVAAGGLVVFGLSGGAGFVRASALRDVFTERVPDTVVRGARAATAALLVYLGIGAVLVAGSLVVHHGRVEELSRQVGGGWGGVPILLLGLLAAPNAAIAAATYLAGPGFAVGAGTHVGPAGATHGLVPAFPVLGALPDGAANPVVWVLVVVTPLSAGIVAARVCGRAATWRARFTQLGATCGLAAVVMAVLAWQGGGSIGSDRLATVGASPWLSGAVVAGELASVGSLALGIVALAGLEWRGWRARTAPAVLRKVVDVQLPTDSDEQITERIEPPSLVVVEPPASRGDSGDSGDGDETGKLAG
jgi:hypothetical protein